MAVGLNQLLKLMQKRWNTLVRSKHTVFGQLIDGETTLEDIANTKVGAQDKPVHDVVIESIDVEDKKLNSSKKYH